MTKRSLLALLLSSAIATSADAGGTVTLSVTAGNARDARALQTGLALFALARDVKSRGHVSQAGARNAAALIQRGRGHRGLIEQRGDDHEASLVQTGRRNTFGIFQFGTGATGHVTQTGLGRAGLLIQYGF